MRRRRLGDLDLRRTSTASITRNRGARDYRDGHSRSPRPSSRNLVRQTARSTSPSSGREKQENARSTSNPGGVYLRRHRGRVRRLRVGTCARHHAATAVQRRLIELRWYRNGYDACLGHERRTDRRTDPFDGRGRAARDRGRRVRRTGRLSVVSPRARAFSGRSHCHGLSVEQPPLVGGDRRLPCAPDSQLCADVGQP